MNLVQKRRDEMKRILLVMVCLALVAGMVFAQAAPEANAKEDEVYKIV